MHPNLEQTILNNVAIFKEEAEIVQQFLTEKSKLLVIKNAGNIAIDMVLLKKEKQIKTILHYILNPFGFTISQINDISSNLKNNGESGKLFLTSSNTLTIDRRFILIKANSENAFNPLNIASFKDLKKSNLLSVEEVSDFKNIKANELVIEKDKLIFPLTIRRKNTGDKFKPFGMKGFKLLSDFLKDQKLNAFEKENCLLLENGNGDIIWVMGQRSDDRYKVEVKTNKLIKLSLIE